MKCLVSAVRGTWMVITSEFLSRVSKSTTLTPSFEAVDSVISGSDTSISMAKALHRVATWLPIRPIPTIPKVFPASSMPINLFFSHFPSFTDLSAMDIFRARDNIIPIVCSATVMEVDSGAFTTITPFSVAA